MVKIAPSNDSTQLWQEYEILSLYLSGCDGVPDIVWIEDVATYTVLIEEPVGVLLEDHLLSLKSNISSVSAQNSGHADLF